MKQARPFLLLIAVSLVVACANQGSIKAVRKEGGPAPICTRAWQLNSAATLELDASQPKAVEFTSSSPCLVEPGGRAVTYFSFALPSYSAPWVLRVESHIDGRALFAPEIMLINRDRKVSRRIPYERFSLRGNQLQTTIFFNSEHADEQYLIVRSAPDVSGQGTTVVESGYFVVPIIAGLIPFFYMQGTEREREYVLSHSGIVKFYALTQGLLSRPGEN